MSEDLFIRRVYTHKGIAVAVDIDLVKKEISLVEKRGNSFVEKSWYFTHRSLEYMNGWLTVLDAMKHAITEASKELKAAKDRDEEKFVNLLVAINDSMASKEERMRNEHYNR